MAQVRFLYNMLTGSTTPMIKLGLFAAGSTTAIAAGQILEKTNTGNTIWDPLDSDYAMTGTDDAIAVAAEDIKAGDRAGYYSIIVPRPGDVFEAPLAAASAMAVGTKLTYSSATALTTGGSNAIGYACGQDNYPTEQGHLASDASPDSGVTVRSTSYVQFTFAVAASYYLTFQQ